MHEFSFAEQVLEGIITELGPYPEAKVVRIRLRAAPALAIEPASLRFALESLSEGTPAEGAKIEIEKGEAQAECPKCGRIDAPATPDSICPKCGKPGLSPAEAELIIEEIELDG
ncbi:MAG TPA: hydrogenase maturation nickel metallochaperone HypA [Candidatus Brocadiia bacterium]|nr:hydrogenase maturation nickel metallochaperone HypA [Candidatus Brocadiia bacterium]